MPYLLRSDGVNDVVSLPSGSTSNVGTTDYTWWVKGTLRAAPSGVAGILGASSAPTSNGFATNATLQLRVYSAGTNRYSTGDNFFEVGVYHHYRLEHDAGGAWRAYRDNMTTPVASGSFNTSLSFAALNQMFRSSNSSAMYTAWDMEEMGITSTTFNETYNADLSGGTGSILPTVSGNNQGTLNNFDVPACWIFYSTGSSFTGTIGKTSLSITTKQLLTSLGYSTSSGKSSLALTTDQLSVSVGTVLGVGKQSLVLSTKPEATQLGYVNVLSKQGYNLLTKQLDVVVGANTPFTDTLNKTTYNLSGKPLSNILGWNNGFDKQTLSINGKQESNELGCVSLIPAYNLVLTNKLLSVQAGAAIPFIGLLNKLQLNLTGKPLSVSAGTVIPFLGSISKAPLTLSGKQLETVRGQLLDISTRHIILSTNLLSLGDIIYPTVPRRRVKLLPDSDIRLYALSNVSRLFTLRR